jgi:hypothetical protein
MPVVSRLVSLVSLYYFAQAQTAVTKQTWRDKEEAPWGKLLMEPR